MNYHSLKFILDNKHLYWSNNSTGAAGDSSTDAKVSSDPNDFLQPLAGNKFYLIIAIIAVIGLSIAVVTLAAKNKAS